MRDSIRPIRWHQECLVNMRKYRETLIADVARARVALARCEADIAKREAQIARAEREGRTGFDCNNYKVKS